MTHTALITPPTVEPITLADAKLHLRVDVSADDTLISSMISAARQHAETLTQRALAPATYCLYLDAFESAIELARPPVAGVTHLKYLDSTGTLVTLDSGQYTVQAGADPTVIVPAYGASWPATLDHVDAVRVTYTAGYAAADLPAAIRAYLLAAIGTLYANRESTAQADRVPKSLEFMDRLLDGWRVWSV